MLLVFSLPDRRHLLQLLNDMEHSPDTKHKEDSAMLLEVLISSAPRLIMPYVSPIQKALLSRLRGAISTGPRGGIGVGGIGSGAGGGIGGESKLS